VALLALHTLSSTGHSRSKQLTLSIFERSDAKWQMMTSECFCQRTREEEEINWKQTQLDYPLTACTFGIFTFACTFGIE
jgi:hypothetical protein